MRRLKLAGLGALNTLAQEAGARTGLALGRPTMLYAIVTVRCPLACRHCDVGRESREAGARLDELGTDGWRALLDELQAWSPGTVVTFTGGEPLVRDDLQALLDHCSRRGLAHGVITNGCWPVSRLEALLGSDTAFVAVSLDGASDTLVDDLRGRAGVFARTTAAIAQLAAWRREGRLRARIIVKCTVMGPNAGQLEALVDLARQLGADGVQLQPLEQNYSVRLMQDPRDDWPARHPLWPTDPRVLDEALARLAARKAGADRAFLLNSVGELATYRRYFADPRAVQATARRCNVGHRALFVAPWGDFGLCPRFGAIGGFPGQRLSEAWASPRARAHRRSIAACRAGCLSSCFADRTFADKAELFLRLFPAR